MVFQRPNPMPISVYENVVFGLRIHNRARDLLGTRRKKFYRFAKRLGATAGGGPAGTSRRIDLDEAVEKALTEVGLWKDLKDKLQVKANTLQLEQQQKLCIARLLPLKPEIILMDEPCSALDVEGTRAIEELMFAMKGRYTLVIVTHNMAQARRTSDECIFMLLGELIEHNRTADLFLQPQNPKTAEYIEGRYG